MENEKVIESEPLLKELLENKDILNYPAKELINMFELLIKMSDIMLTIKEYKKSMFELEQELQIKKYGGLESAMIK